MDSEKTKRTFDICVLILTMGLLFALFGILAYRPKPVVYDGYSSRDMYVELPKNWREEPEPMAEPEVFEWFREHKRKLSQVPITITYKQLVLGDGYRVFLTAYCAEECGWNYWTSSGEYCHRADGKSRIDEPTTCAVDLNYFRYGTMFYVPSEDRAYIAEDTGAFRGMWLDLYHDDMMDVLGYNTRYETVYICWYEEVEKTIMPSGMVENIVLREVMKNEVG